MDATASHSPLTCEACKVIDRADGHEDGKLYKTAHFKIQNERKLVASPVQFDETPPTITRAPQFAEHTDDILREIGKSEDEILQLKIDGACT